MVSIKISCQELPHFGEILKKEGYNQIFMCGSDISFGGRDKFYKQHGDYEIFDYISAKNNGRYTGGLEGWGFLDKNLYGFAKEEITRLSKEEKPFNCTILTVDTHHMEGLPCNLCPKEYDQQYANVIACASKQLDNFIEWIKQQDFYQNTTIVFVGDHATMSNVWEEYYPEDYDRTMVNCFINSAVSPKGKLNSRDFYAMDMFPTILASLGAQIEGDRLGIGTNLFSNKLTLAEELGDKYFTKEVSKRSEFYDQTILEIGK